MTSCDVTWRQDIGFLRNLWEMFPLSKSSRNVPLLICSSGARMKSFAPLKWKLLNFLYFQLQYGDIPETPTYTLQKTPRLDMRGR